MRLRSTGLGKTELEAKIAEVKRVDDVVIFYVNTTKPVKRHLRAGIQFSDVPDILKGMLKLSVLPLVIRALFRLKDNPEEPEKF